MRTVEIDLAEELVTKLRTMAAERGISIDQLVSVAIEEKLAVDAATTYVLDKNAELYRRLS